MSRFFCLFAEFCGPWHGKCSAEWSSYLRFFADETEIRGSEDERRRISTRKHRALQLDCLWWTSLNTLLNFVGFNNVFLFMTNPNKKFRGKATLLSYALRLWIYSQVPSFLWKITTGKTLQCKQVSNSWLTLEGGSFANLSALFHHHFNGHFFPF